MSGFMKIKVISSDVVFCLRLAVTVCACYLIGRKFSSLFSEVPDTIGGLWSIISAIFIIHENKVESCKEGFNRLMGSLIGAFLSAIVLAYTPGGPWFMTLAIFLTALFCMAAGMHHSYKVACVTTAVILTTWELSTKTHPWLFSSMRFIESCIGIFIALAVMHIPVFNKDK
jgi:uncharacterized membrane protein YccC